MMITPSGYIAHRAMFDRIGRYLYPDDWLGNLEYTARDGLVSIEQYEIDCKTPGRGATGSGSESPVESTRLGRISSDQQ